MLTGIKTNILIIFYEPIYKFIGNLRELFKINKKKFVLSLLLTLFIFGLSIFISNRLFSYRTNSIAEKNIISLVKPSSIGIFETDNVKTFVDAYQKAISLFSPIFDNFISATPDPTGKVVKEKDSYKLNLGTSDKIFYENGDNSLSSKRFASIALEIALPLIVLLIVINSFNFIYNPEQNTGIKEFIKRVIIVIISILLTPMVFSISILSTNLMASRFTEGKPLTTFINSFTEKIKNNVVASKKNTLADKLNSVVNLTLFNVPGFIEALPILLPLTLILLLFLFVAFQFIIRFLNLFFLTCIYPFVMIFYISPAGAGIPGNFWKQWFTLLIHQPAFVLGYVIIQNLLNDMVDKNGINFVELLLFLGLLVFLASINILTASIFGDIYTAISTNIHAGIATAIMQGVTIGNLKDLPSKGLAHITNSTGSNHARKESLFGRAKKGIALLKKDINIAKKAVNFAQKHGILQGSDISTDLKVKGITVKEKIFNNNGVIDISGSFFTKKDNANGLNTLYASQKDALLDGIKPSNLIKKDFSNLHVKDLSKKFSTNLLNEELRVFAKKTGVDTTNLTKLSRGSSERSISNNMKAFEGFNNYNKIDGYAYTKSNKNIDGNNKISKITIYQK